MMHSDHVIVGHLNPHCARCGLSVMQITQRLLAGGTAACDPCSLPFHGVLEQNIVQPHTLERRS